MNNLDDENLYDTLDPEGMGALIGAFGQQCRAAWEIVGAINLPPKYREAKQLLILGMGGSAIGGDLLRTLVSGECRVPISVSREYSAPAWATSETLAIAVSHSGNTEETLSALRQAQSAGAMLLGIGTGGDLAQANLPMVRYKFEGQPRAALGYLFTLLLGVVSRLGWIADPTPMLNQAWKGVEELGLEIGPGSPTSRNVAKQLASKLSERIPVVYGAGVLGEVGHRWKTQLNENAKTTAFYDLMSELNHNAVVGYEFPPLELQKLVFVMLQSSRTEARITRRFQVTEELLRQRGLSQETVHVKGESALAEMLWAIHLGDYVSYYLAILNGVDPTPVRAIDHLKRALKA